MSNSRSGVFLKPDGAFAPSGAFGCHQQSSGRSDVRDGMDTPSRMEKDCVGDDRRGDGYQ
jgi:hypothetical protein